MNAALSTFAAMVMPLLALEQTGVTFRTSDAEMQRLFDAAEEKAAANIVRFTPALKVLVEGGGYGNVWIETQPMGGEMYAKRNIEVALNNQLVFLLGQRADGRLPGMVVSGENVLKHGWDKKPPEGYVWLPEHGMAADFEMFQGYCFPDPAWRMYFWAGKDRGYLGKLHAALEKHDAYLWRTRDSNGDGLLETWCLWDTGEDNSSRLLTRNAPTNWPFDLPPSDPRTPDPQDPAMFRKYWSDLPGNPQSLARDQVLAPFASMDVMAYSYEGRATLAKIAKELGNNREEFWKQQAEDVRQRLIKGLWDPERHACFDRDRNGRRLDELIHNNLRCMWHGIFTQEMADAFIRHHLLNPDEFWTPVPLVSIAINEKLYQNAPGNNWSGQPQGLTFQRAIRALENYGHHAEVTLIGRKLLPVLIRNDCRFPQQLDPVTGKASGPKPDGYGPMMLAALEYISRMHGIHPDVSHGQIWWSALEGVDSTTYTQRWADKKWTMDAGKGRFTASLNDKELFSCTRGVRIVTDLEGSICEIVGISPSPQAVVLQVGGKSHEFTVKPNEVWRIGDKPALLRAAPFDPPF